MATGTTALLDITKETNKIVLDAIAENTKRNMTFAKSIVGIVARPYAGNDLKINVADAVERVEKIVDLTMSDLELSGKATVELVEKCASQAEKAREESLTLAREYAKTGVTTIKHALETTEERLETFAKRLEATTTEVVADVTAATEKVAKAN